MSRRIPNDWAKDHIAALARGQRVRFRPVGGSMAGIVESGDLVEVAPPEVLGVGTVVLVTVGNFTYLHLVKEIRFTPEAGLEYLIGNNRGGVNGWASYRAVHGVLAAVNPATAV